MILSQARTVINKILCDAPTYKEAAAINPRQTSGSKLAKEKCIFCFL